MQRATIIVLVALMAVVALAEGQYYEPRAYYTIETEGHASAPVTLRRLRRSSYAGPQPYGYGEASATGYGARPPCGGGSGWGAPPRGAYGSARA